MVLNDASGIEPHYIFAQRSLLKTKDALSRDVKGCSLRSRSFSTTPLASFLGSFALLSQEGQKQIAWPKHSGLISASYAFGFSPI